jgi:hypothetical protein
MHIDELTPLWALRSVGRGQSMAWTSDLAGRWGRAWSESTVLATLAPVLLTPLLPPSDKVLDMAWFRHDDILDIAITSSVAQMAPEVVLIGAD